MIEPGFDRCPHTLQDLWDLLSRYIQMRAGAEALASGGADEDAERFQLHGKLPGIAELRVDREIDEIRDGRFDGEAGDFDDPCGEKSGVVVVFLEALNVVLDGINRRGGHHACLTKCPSEEFADPSGLGDVALISYQDRTHGAAETFGETDRDRVEMAADFRRGEAARDGCVE